MTVRSQDASRAAPILIAPPPREIRDQLAELVRRDLVGPAGGDAEELATGSRDGAPAVRDRYPVGCLAPKGSGVDPAELDSLVEVGDLAGDDDADDDAPPPIGTLVPSSMGLSFVVDGSQQRIVVEAS